MRKFMPVNLNFQMKMELDTDFILFIKINSEFTTRHKQKTQNYKLVEYNTGENLGDFGFGNNFSRTTPKHNPKKQELISQTSLKLDIAALEKALSRE